jgi:hypothetical protein
MTVRDICRLPNVCVDLQENNEEGSREVGWGKRSRILGSLRRGTEKWLYKARLHWDLPLKPARYLTVRLA